MTRSLNKRDEVLLRMLKTPPKPRPDSMTKAKRKPSRPEAATRKVKKSG